MSTPMIYHSGVGFAIGASTRVERTAVTGDKTGEVSVRESSERVSAALPSHRHAPLDRYDYRDHLIGNSDILAAWAIAIGVFLLLMILA